MRLVFASTNQGKVREVQRFFSDRNVEVLGLNEIAAVCPELGKIPDVEESGHTYEENARIKAIAYRAWCGESVLADDAGLEVEALGGAPGVRSARYAGEHASMRENIEKLLQQLEGITKRKARFVSVLVLLRISGEEILVRGTLDGQIGFEEKGAGGFGYDGVFLVGASGRTLAEEKEGATVIETHRTRALRMLLERIGGRYSK